MERNPWDRAPSHYCWRLKNQSYCDFDSYLDSEDIFRLKHRGIELYSVDGQVAMDGHVCSRT